MIYHTSLLFNLDLVNAFYQFLASQRTRNFFMNSFRVRHLERALKLFEEGASGPVSQLDLFLKRYFQSHKRIAQDDKHWIAENAYEAFRWQGLLTHLTPGKQDWAHKLKTYFVNDRWRSLSGSDSIAPHSRCSVPEPLYSKLSSVFGTGKAIEICNIYNERPRTFLRVNTLKTQRDQAFKALVARGVPVEKSAVSPCGLVVADDSRLRDVPEFKTGLVEIQDDA